MLEAETGSFSSVLRASLKSARQSPVKTALAAGGLIAIPPAIADNVKLVFPDRPPATSPIVNHFPPATAQDDLVRLLGSQLAGTVVTTRIDFGDGHRVVISGKAFGKEAERHPRMTQEARPKN